MCYVRSTAAPRSPECFGGRCKTICKLIFRVRGTNLSTLARKSGCGVPATKTIGDRQRPFKKWPNAIYYDSLCFFAMSRLWFPMVYYEFTVEYLPPNWGPLSRPIRLLIWGLGFGVWGFGCWFSLFRVSGFGFSGSRVFGFWVLGYCVTCFVFRISGFGLGENLRQK